VPPFVGLPACYALLRFLAVSFAPFTTEHGMTAQPNTHQHPASPETFVIAKLGDGFRVYSPDQPQQIYLVSGTPESPRCTCPAFRSRTDEPEASCDHIDAVFGHPGAAAPATPHGATDRKVNTTMVHTPPTGTDREAAVQMTLKRSISPDGRIDSLSIEFSCDVAPMGEAEIQQHAMRLIELQHTLVHSFSQNGGHPKAAAVMAPVASMGNGNLPAQLVSVGGMDGKWGRRLFLIVQVQDKLLKFFGSEKQLTEALGEAGFGGIGRIGEGMVLNLPCQVTTKPSADGRYQNVEKILPVAAIPR
jgi:hypothetical protein